MGFTVKANSEGQPGPQDFGYDHGDGANGIAAAVAPLGMTVYWRTFVYNADVDNDRLKRAYLEFGPIDDEPQEDGTRGRFEDNVFLQTKNGPLDFQAREPFHPMFGRMENTNQALELQITQEYTGHDKMLTYLGPMWEEVLKTDTYATDASGKLLEKRRVGNIVDGTAQGHSDTAIVGVANLGNADNLTGHHFSQSNLFAFGRQAWDWKLDSEDVAEDWVRMTWSNRPRVVDTVVKMMMGSWEALASYQTPLGIAHQFTSDDHYDPNPSQWFMKDDWSPVYYNKADSAGLGFDRSAGGSNFVAQYFPTLEARYGNIETVPENLLMWFHHVPWDRRMDSGRIFWDELVYRYQMGVQYVTWMRETWDSLERRHRRPPLLGGEGEAGDPRGRCGQLARHQRELLAGVQRPAPCRSTTPRSPRASSSAGSGSAGSTSRRRPTPSPWRPARRRGSPRSGPPIPARATRSSPRPRASRDGPSSRSPSATSSGRSSRTTCSTWSGTPR